MLTTVSATGVPLEVDTGQFTALHGQTNETCLLYQRALLGAFLMPRNNGIHHLLLQTAGSSS